jgi:hypothetical protein
MLPISQKIPTLLSKYLVIVLMNGKEQQYACSRAEVDLASYITVVPFGFFAAQVPVLLSHLITYQENAWIIPYRFFGGSTLIILVKKIKIFKIIYWKTMTGTGILL